MFSEIRNAQGERLDYDYLPGREGDSRLVILGHGVTGNKDRPVITHSAKALQGAGIATLSFSFAGNGSSEGRFEDCTITKEVQDLGAVLDAVGDRVVAYVGHSMGAAVGVIRASGDERIRVLVSLAGMVNTAAFAQREFGQEVPDQGYMWEDETCPLSSAYMSDMAAIHSVLDLGEKIHAPWLLVHGTEDDVVPLQDSVDISAKAKDLHRFVQITGADHSFSLQIPQMTSELVAWVANHLKG